MVQNLSPLNINDNELDQTDPASLFKPRRKLPLASIFGVSIVAVVAVGIVIGLMWQSNSFIALNQDIRSDASYDIGDRDETFIVPTIVADFSNPDAMVQTYGQANIAANSYFSPGQQFIAPVDQRFGINGGCDTAKSLGLAWTYNWGVMSNAERNSMQTSNNREIKCFEDTRNIAIPVNTLITLAKNDGGTDKEGNPLSQEANESAAWLQSDIDKWVAKARSEGKWDAADQAAFDLLKRELPTLTCDIYTTVNYKDNPLKTMCENGNWTKRYYVNRMIVDYVQIPYIASRYPGAHYQIANEPEFGFSFFPEKYAKVYKVFYDRLKKYDPDAKVAIGSLGMVEYDHPFNQEDINTFRKNTGYDWVMAELKNKGLDNGNNRDIAWLALVYKAYQQNNGGRSLPVDFIALHPYPWPPNSPEYIKIVNGEGYSKQWPPTRIDEAVADTMSQIDKFKAATSKAPYNYGKLPIWITEVAVLVNENPTRKDLDDEAAAVQHPYMQKLYQQLFSSGKAQKIFWHTGFHPDDHEKGKPMQSVFVFTNPKGSNNWNVLGQELLVQKNKYTDAKPPRIGVIGMNRKSSTLVTYTVRVRDMKSPGNRASGMYRLWYSVYSGDRTQIPTARSQWRSILSTAAKIEFDVIPPSSGGKYFVAVQAEDAAGNISAARIK